MTEKNRFSKLLKSLMSAAEVKNYTLAQELQYDVSYISKWISGQMLPSEKSATRILEAISKCVVENAEPQALLALAESYALKSPSELQLALYDHLLAEYRYVKALQRDAGSSIAPKRPFSPRCRWPSSLGGCATPCCAG